MYGSSRNFRLVLSLIFQYWLLHPSHGVHLTNTLSFAAIDLAKSAGMDEEDISAAISASEEITGVERDTAVNGEGNVLSILEIAKNSKEPVLPLCCSPDGEDDPYNECGGGVVGSKEKKVVKKRWTVPSKLVSTQESTVFKLEKTVLSCQYAAFSASLSLSLDSQQNHYFYPDGNLKFENEFFRIDEYCISSFRKSEIVLRICQANCTDPSTPCIHKCCGLDEVYSFGNDDYPTGCQPITRDFGTSDVSSSSERLNKPFNKWTPILYHNLTTRLTKQEASKIHPHYILKYPSNFKGKCKSGKTTVFPFGSKVADYLSMITGKPFKNLNFKLRHDGFLLYPFLDSSGHEIPVINRILNYCLDGAQHYGESSEYLNTEQQTVLFLCSGGVDEAFQNHIILPEADRKLKNDSEVDAVPAAISAEIKSPVGVRVEQEYRPMEGPSSVEIYTKSRQRPHVLYQLFKFNSHSRPASIVQNHNIKRIIKIKTRRPTIVSLFPNHPNRTKIISKKRIKKPKFQLPVCCPFPTDVNDGQTYHCGNRMVDLQAKGHDSRVKVKPIWNVPGKFMTSGDDSTFTLDTSPINCGYGYWQLQGFIHNFPLNYTDMGNSSTNSNLPSESGILSNGLLKYENEFYNTDEFCVNGLSPRIMEVMICKPNCRNKNLACISKCCGVDEAYSLGLETGYRGCVPLSYDEPKFHPTLYKNMNHQVRQEIQDKTQIHFTQRFPPTFQKQCYRGITLAFPFSEDIANKLNNPDSAEKGNSFKSLQFRFRSDGKLMYHVPNDDGTSLTAVYDRKEFCVDLVTDYGIDEPIQNHENRTILFICASQPTAEDENFK